MTPLVIPGPGCALLVEEIAVAPDGAGWRDETRLEVAGAPGCPWVDVVLPPGAALEAIAGRSRLGDGRGARLGAERFERRTRDVAGTGAVRVHLPELIQGDQAVIEVSRRWVAGFEWAPARHGARFAQLEGATGPVAGFAADGDTWWASPPGPDAVARFGTPDAPAALPSARPASVAESLDLRLPDGHPQLTLYPGGGSSVRVEQTFAFEPSPEERAWVVPLDEGATEIAWSARPPGSARVDTRDDSLRIVLAGSEGPSTVAVAWTAPDAPTFGEGDAALRVTCDGGEIAWEEVADRRFWRLVSWNGSPVLPDRAAFEKAVARRFGGVNVPGVALPNELRGRSADASLAEDALTVLRARSGIGGWPSDPLWPRRLVRARRSLAYTPVEAALVLAGWLDQGGLDASWALTRPFGQGPGAPQSPAGFTRPLVVVDLPDGPRWLDPACTECAPWEIAPGAAGPALGPLGLAPPAPVGRWEVEGADGAVRWSLEGAAALALREWLAAVPVPDRGAALAARLGGPVETAEGIAQAGAPIRLTARGAAGQDPLAERDLGWVGTRVWRRPAGPLGDLDWETPELRWTRVTAEGITTETLEVRAPVVPDAVWATLVALRKQAADNESSP